MTICKDGHDWELIDLSLTLDGIMQAAWFCPDCYKWAVTYRKHGGKNEEAVIAKMHGGKDALIARARQAAPFTGPTARNTPGEPGEVAKGAT